MAEQTWFIRSRGRVFGPFTALQLGGMRERGQFTRFHEVSLDRQNWMSAGKFAEFFPSLEGSGPTTSRGPGDPQVYEIDEAGDPAGPAQGADPGEATWYYSRAGQPAGPVPLQQIQRMLARGEIGPDALLWRAGMGDWLPANRVSEVASSPPGPGAGTANTPAPGSPGAMNVAHSGEFPRTSGMAIASLVLGLLWLIWIGSLLATIFGSVALAQIARSRGTLTGKGMAVAGLTLGIIGLTFLLILVIMWVGPSSRQNGAGF